MLCDRSFGPHTYSPVRVERDSKGPDERYFRLLSERLLPISRTSVDHQASCHTYFALPLLFICFRSLWMCPLPSTIAAAYPFIGSGVHLSSRPSPGILVSQLHTHTHPYVLFSLNQRWHIYFKRDTKIVQTANHRIKSLSSQPYCLCFFYRRIRNLPFHWQPCGKVQYFQTIILCTSRTKVQGYPTLFSKQSVSRRRLGEWLQCCWNLVPC